MILFEQDSTFSLRRVVFLLINKLGSSVNLLNLLKEIASHSGIICMEKVRKIFTCFFFSTGIEFVHERARQL